MTERGKVRIAVDAMGGDHAPAEIIKGALKAAEQGDVEIFLVGDQDVLSREIGTTNLSKLPVQIVPSQGVIEEGEAPNVALRQKPQASVMVASQLVKMGKADAFVSMGSTGAIMACAYFTLGLLEGIERPTLGGPFLGLAPKTVFIDLGTNVDSRPIQLLGFGILGAVLATTLVGIEKPRVALLSVGSEEGKGNRQVKEAYPLFQTSDLNFVGNIEGDALLTDKADVVICDGFVGNVLMKFSEGLGQSISDYLLDKLSGQLAERKAEELTSELYRLTHLVEHRGGGPILGVNGVAIVGHGRSHAPSVSSAIDMARTPVEGAFVQNMQERLSQMSANLSINQEQP